MVLSPGAVLPRWTTPANPARNMAITSAGDRRVLSAQVVAARRKKVPYSGPEAPPHGFDQWSWPLFLTVRALSGAG